MKSMIKENMITKIKNDEPNAVKYAAMKQPRMENICMGYLIEFLI